MFDLFNKKRVRELEEIAEGYRKRNTDLIIERDRAKNRAEEWQEMFTKGIELNGKLADENQKLIGWINKILDEVGTCTARDIRPFTIPICKTSLERKYEEFDGVLKPYREETVIIPEIRLIKRSYKE